MKHFTYPKVPSPTQFQKDTSITFAYRKDDIVLKHIDWLLEKYQSRSAQGMASKTNPILCDLFMTCNFWIKSYHEGNRRMEKERYPAVLALFEIVVNTLCTALRCTRGSLPDILVEIYGRDMHFHGIQVDHDQDKAKYLTKMERQMYRLRFKSGRAYQYQWWQDDPLSAPLVPAESSRAYTALRRRGLDGHGVDGSENFGCFVMTIERELYMAKPFVPQGPTKDGMFHSSFTCGDVVTMAGTMLIKDGRILGIRADSGHYKPTQMNMALLIQALTMYGVDLKHIKIYEWNGFEVGNITDFMKSRMSWDEFVKQRRLERTHRLETDEARDIRGLDRKFPRLVPPPLPPRPGQARLPQQQQPVQNNQEDEVVVYQ